ncbi:MAG: hypothetical protein MUQ32_02315 [Chloroflexi bacterium]|nr:hypothetical protein [Chloroflexota bacterium]
MLNVAPDRIVRGGHPHAVAGGREQEDRTGTIPGGLGVEDRVDATKLVADPAKSLRQGALVPTLKNGYTVYSQVTLEVMDRLWEELKKDGS